MRTMIPTLLALTGLTVGGGLACSHAEPKKPAATPARAAADTLPHPAPAPVAQAAPAPASPGASASGGGDGDAVFFDFDSALIRDDARPVLQRVAKQAKAKDAALRIEGNCDEAGTVEYNLALGEVRAKAAQDYLTRLGVPRGHISTLTYGKEHLKFQDDAKNRRDDLVLQSARR